MSRFGRFRQLLTSVLSQSVASMGTVLLSIAVARQVSNEDFGQFAIVTATWIISVGVIRAFTAEVLLFELSGLEKGALTKKVGECTAFALVAALIVACLFIVIGLSASPLLVFAYLGFGLPAFVMQDANRLVLIAIGRQTTALVLDLSYVGLLVGLLGSFFQSTSLTEIMIGWALAAYVAAAFGTLMLRAMPSYRLVLDWYGNHRRQGAFFVGDFLVTNGVSNAAVYVVAIFASLSSAGALRGTQVLLVPILLIIRGIGVALGPELQRAVRSGRPREVLLICSAVSVAQILVVLLTTVAVVAAPMTLMEFLVGDSAEATKQLFPAAACATIALGLAIAPTLGLKAAGQVARALRIKALNAPFILILLVPATLLLGASGSQFVLAGGESVRAMRSWRSLISWGTNKS